MSETWADDDFELYDPIDRADYECDHEHADIDILSGHAACPCGYTWWLSADEIAAELRFMAEYAEHVAEEAATAPPASVPSVNSSSTSVPGQELPQGEG